VSTDGTNDYNYHPYDTHLVGVQNVNADFSPTEGGAPALLGDSRCQPSAGHMLIESRKPGFSDWGLTFGANFREATQDGSEWDGIGLWARHGKGSAVTSFNATLPERHTSNQESADGAQYECRDGLDVANLCDPFGRGIDASEDWRFYLLPFDSLAQQGFGKASPLGQLNVEEILGLSFQIGAGTWNLRIDEIVYYRER
jgi:hypothetical protein